MIPLKKHISLTLDQEIVDKIRVLAEDSDRSLSRYINLVLREYLYTIEEAKRFERVDELK